MAEFVPFAGLRYDGERVSLAAVLAPPYDVIKGALRDELIAKSPHNIVNIELAADYGSDATPEQYERCAQLLKQWRDEGILVRDDRSFYVYEQDFAIPGSGQIKKRRGVLGALQLEEFGAGVQPHEHTLSGPKQDRLQLLRATRTNTSPIFALYTDDDGWINALLDNVCLSAPDCDARDGQNVAHRLWKVQDDETVNAIEAALEDQPILIADGHHRYETALNFRDECRTQAESAGKTWTGSEDENFVMMMCVATSDDGLIVLPTHRVVKIGDEYPSGIALLDFLEAVFDVQEVRPPDAETLLQQINDPQFANRAGRFGVYLEGRAFLLQLHEGNKHHELMDFDKSAAYRDLDVSILHSLILEEELGIGAAELAAGGHIAYTIEAREAIEKVEGGDWNAAFLMRATPVEQVREVASQGDKMPQKSTYFFPKLVTGLVLRPID